MVKLVKIKFYKNGYETFGHTSGVVCSQISAMQFISEGLFLKLDKKAKCFDGKSGTGYTALMIKDIKLLNLFKVYKRDFKEWADSEFKNNKYKIIFLDENLKWEKVLKEMKKRNLSFD